MTTPDVPLELRAADGYRLAATRYALRGAPPRAHLVVAGATGVPQGFYRRFAEHAAGRGFAVLTLDYRGIGRSAPPSLRGFVMDYRDWGRLDLAAAVEDARARAGADGVPVVVIGHSYGGHALGLLPNHAAVTACWTFATGAGWHGWMPVPERWRVRAMWSLIGPLLVRRHGYLRWSALGMGEDLPRDVFRQWRHWCGFPRYFFDDPAVAEAMRTQFAAVRTPIVAANATDDLWAPPRSRDAFMAGYAQAMVEGRDIDVRARGLGTIGHMGYFRPHARVLWDEALDWLGDRADAARGTATVTR